MKRVPHNVGVSAWVCDCSGWGTHRKDELSTIRRLVASLENSGVYQVLLVVVVYCNHGDVTLVVFLLTSRLKKQFVGRVRL